MRMYPGDSSELALKSFDWPIETWSAEIGSHVDTDDWMEAFGSFWR